MAATKRKTKRQRDLEAIILEHVSWFILDDADAIYAHSIVGNVVRDGVVYDDPALDDLTLREAVFEREDLIRDSRLKEAGGGS